MPILFRASSTVVCRGALLIFIVLVYFYKKKRKTILRSIVITKAYKDKAVWSTLVLLLRVFSGQLNE